MLLGIPNFTPHVGELARTAEILDLYTAKSNAVATPSPLIITHELDTSPIWIWTFVFSMIVFSASLCAM